MLTKKQIDELPKGEFSNLILSANFPNHGKSKGVNNRIHILPVDRFGKVTNNLKQIVGHKRMLLNRQQHRMYK